MLMKILVLATRTGGVPESIAPDMQKYLVPAKNYESISEKIKELARVFEAGVEVLHVKADNRKRVSKELLENALAELNYNYMEIESEEIIGEIEKEIKKLPADILVMIPHKYSFWESLIHRSKTRMMASMAAVPVLSLPYS